MREFVKIHCYRCLEDMGFAVNPGHIPKTWCAKCVESYLEETLEHEHKDD